MIENTGRHIESSVHIHASPQKVLNAFVDPVYLKDWWGVERSLIELRSGGMYSLAWEITDRGIGFVSTGVVAEYLPACQLRLEKFLYFNPDRPILGPMELTIMTTPEDSGTVLTVVQSGYQRGKDWDWYYEAVKEAWPAVLSKLKTYLEGH